MGNRRFNVKDVGFEATESAAASKFDTSIEGNSNKGHEYGVGSDGQPKLTDAEIDELLAFLKTL